jgi:2-phosphosulfolactate phosphatase
MSDYFDQSDSAIRCEWGLHGVEALAPISDVVIIVDVLSFSTCVEIAVNRGATVFPYRWKDESAIEFAKQKNAILAGARGEGKYSLSPGSLVHIQPGERIVLPSPNGGTLTLATGTTPTLAGSLRNASAVAKYAKSLGTRIAVIPAGERWEDDSVRFAVEDFIGAGAIISALRGTRSPEAEAAMDAFENARRELPGALRRSSSGKELIGRCFPEDVEIASPLDVSTVVPVFRDGAFSAG